MIEQKINELKYSQTTRSKALILFKAVGFKQAFGRTSISKLTGITLSPAGELIKKLKTVGLIYNVKGQGKGKYKFIEPQE